MNSPSVWGQGVHITIIKRPPLQHAWEDLVPRSVVHDLCQSQLLLMHEVCPCVDVGRQWGHVWGKVIVGPWFALVFLFGRGSCCTGHK